MLEIITSPPDQLSATKWGGFYFREPIHSQKRSCLLIPDKSLHNLEAVLRDNSLKVVEFKEIRVILPVDNEIHFRTNRLRSNSSSKKRSKTCQNVENTCLLFHFHLKGALGIWRWWSDVAELTFTMYYREKLGRDRD